MLRVRIKYYEQKPSIGHLRAADVEDEIVKSSAEGEAMLTRLPG
jgi:hypothetical protein